MPDTEVFAQFDRFITAAERKKRPLWTHLDLTYRCNLDCVHCYCQHLHGGDWNNRTELAEHEWRRVLDELAEAGALFLTLSGGEALLREDFFRIAAYARQKQFCLTVFTNGTLINEDRAQRLRELSPLAVEMSIYGTTADVHESVTRQPGSFAAVCAAVKLLKQNNLRVVLKTAFLIANAHQSDQLEAFAYALGADDFHFSLETSRRNDGSCAPQAFQLDEGQLAAFMRQYYRRPNLPSADDAFRHAPLAKPLCATGALSCYISPYGDVYPCVVLLRTMGNVREKKFADLWQQESPLRQQLEGLKTYGDMPTCRSCAYVAGCKKCIGMAQLETNDPAACYTTLKTLARLDCQLSREDERDETQEKAV